ncbi:MULTISPECIES: hypothetical protein [Methylobacterium]|uniref:Chemotaxis protein CheA n=1 Tax=Methylobacterium jeotgali TaxID=381630 RepID=A0ABQ4SNZ5_9HYPH|nr:MULTISPECIES: hypothetical protein [Methylobacterium]PIU04372.1 MAG: hypothetical protein COT56_20170 [Methylobacterium sp. CG09_land_8_20_14_0_10_71_15]PIU15824.1 MAG: hypothetical protein COT28_02745 [Methylobacterium sp. CG08_land_8_20_14_0_20_71_15]GBU18360.1 hypothetical protein AwMethylo_25750 [Methylobacterium sp.]GJE04937.1 hypothetical protein AOPFMNJM_0229 [Methylobacterium jeotgali]
MTGEAATPFPRTARRRRAIPYGRIAAGLGIAAAAGGAFAGANALLAGFAGPPPRPVIVTTRAAEWPDLRDGVPALAPRPEAPKTAAVMPAAPAPSPLPAVGPASLRAALDPAPDAKAAPLPASRPAATARPLPPIEPVSLVSAVREAAPILPTRAAAIIRPTETVRAREAATAAFAALPPENEAEAAPAKTLPKPAPKPVASRPEPKPAAKPAKVAQQPAPAPRAAVAAAEPESDDTEVLGVKIPSLAATGRKIRDVFTGPDTTGTATP